ncbi:MAG: DUF1015 domain-containing protein, partial [Oscillospiraceae bacterium]|nr:DUF1015 domain-containing protein [Oscillospiraceae bacterium]
MAKIEGFRALRFTKSAGAIDALVCPPYDVISENQRYALLERAAHNIVRLELPRDGEDPYREAAKILINWQNDGILACDGQPGLYICEEEFANDGVIMRINGMIARVGLEEQSSGVILPHEETLSKAKTDRLNLMKATGCNFSQIYSLYMDDGSTRDSVTKILARQPDVAFEGGDGVT